MRSEMHEFCMMGRRAYVLVNKRSKGNVLLTSQVLTDHLGVILE